MDKKVAAGAEKWRGISEKYPEANFLQSPAYGEMNRLIGEKVIEAEFSGAGYSSEADASTADVEAEVKSGRALMIIRDAKRGRYMEIPGGPLIDWENAEMARTALNEISEIARREKCVFVRMRPQIPATAENLRFLADLGLKKSPMHLAAEHTVMLDLRLSEEELLKNMRRQTRYEVRRADKLGIEVARSNTEGIFEEFHRVQLKTAKRQGFVPPSLEVLLAERGAFADQIWIYVAKTGVNATSRAEEGASEKVAEGETIAYGLIIGDGKEADYYEAASTELNRKLPGAYALIWRAMRDMKAAGYERFNLWGIAPKNQPHHRYAGVTTFKTGFGGKVVEFVPAHDLVISRMGYLKDLIVEKARKKWRHL